jgi:hypothetical protein
MTALSWLRLTVGPTLGAIALGGKMLVRPT